MTAIDFEYEKQEREMLFSLAKDGDTFFDVGANVGLYSISFAQRFPNSHIYAFEPILETAIKLKENVDRYETKKVHIYGCGLSDRVGEAMFCFSPSDPGATSMAPLEERFGPTVTTRQFVNTIDNFSGPSITPDVIKCDVEGAEFLVFRGGAQVIRGFKPTIQCEMLRKWAKRFNYHPNDIIEFLGGVGYQCFTLRDGNLERFETMTDETVETNFFFIHPERRKL